MSESATAQRVRLYVGESDHWGAVPLYLAVLDRLRAAGCSGATAFRGIAGFGSHHRIHTASLVDLAANLPIVVEWVDPPGFVERMLPEIRAMAPSATITVEEVSVLRRGPLAP